MLYLRSQSVVTFLSENLAVLLPSVIHNTHLLSTAGLQGRRRPFEQLRHRATLLLD